MFHATPKGACAPRRARFMLIAGALFATFSLIVLVAAWKIALLLGPGATEEGARNRRPRGPDRSSFSAPLLVARHVWSNSQ